MDIELLRQGIKMEQLIGNESTQILLEGDIIVPDVNPDIATILQDDAKVFVEKVEILDGRINYIGKMEVQVLYLARGTEKPIHSMTTTMNFDEFINLEGVESGMWVEVTPTIQNVDYKVLNDRKISLRGIVNINVEAEKSETIELVTDAQNLNPQQIKKNKISVNKTIDAKNDRFIIREQIPISTGSPNVKGILQSGTRISNKDVRCVSGKVNISGEVVVTLLYKGDSDESIIEIVEREIAFNGGIDVPNADDDMYATADLTVHDFFTTIKADEDGEDRIIEVEFSVGARVRVTNQEQMEVLEDAYVINKELILEKKEIKYPKLICRNNNQSTIKDVIQVEGPDVLQVFKVGGDCIVDEVTVNDDRIVAEGVVNVNVLYIAENDETPVCSYKTILPFRQVIETRGSKPNMNKKVIGSVDHIGFNMLSDKEIELRILINFSTEIIEINTHNIVTDAELIDIPKETLEKMPSMIVYIVQKGDTLWNIAKKYNTDINDITIVNQIENPDLIYEGQKLLILKKIMV